MQYILRTLFIFLLAFTYGCSPLTLTAKGPSYQVEEQPAAMTLALSLPTTGIVKQKKNGFLYLDVDNSFITEVIPYLDISATIKPLKTGSKSMGAHISIMTEDEAKKLNLLTVPEVGSEISFEVLEIRSFSVSGAKTWAIIVTAPSLEALRVQYGLPPKLQNHDFHITLGKEASTATTTREAVEWELQEAA